MFKKSGILKIVGSMMAAIALLVDCVGAGGWAEDVYFVFGCVEGAL